MIDISKHKVREGYRLIKFNRAYKDLGKEEGDVYIVRDEVRVREDRVLLYKLIGEGYIVNELIEEEDKDKSIYSLFMDIEFSYRVPSNVEEYLVDVSSNVNSIVVDV